MKKYIIEMDPSQIKNFGLDYIQMFEEFDYIEGKKLLKLDFEKNRKILVLDIHLKPGKRLSREYSEGNFKILEVFQSNRVIHTCLVSLNFSQTVFAADNYNKDMLSLYDDIIFDLPFFGNKSKFTFSLITENQYLDQFFNQLQKYGKIKLISVQKPNQSSEDLLEGLTPRQRDAILLAKELGYYEWPRKMNATQIAKHMNITKSTLVEHLRKAENAIIKQILIGF
ncbi:MAG: helix-turn-helix domain-containing protein [Promethearchaeota archaeon]|jgi:predicted DNA binding protein